MDSSKIDSSSEKEDGSKFKVCLIYFWCQICLSKWVLFSEENSLLEKWLGIILPGVVSLITLKYLLNNWISKKDDFFNKLFHLVKKSIAFIAIWLASFYFAGVTVRHTTPIFSSIFKQTPFWAWIIIVLLLFICFILYEMNESRRN